MPQNNRPLSNSESNADNQPATLEAIVANTCFCKLRENCHDKHSSECMKERNIYRDFIESKAAKQL